MTQPVSTYPRPGECMTTTPILSATPIIIEMQAAPLDLRTRVLLVALRRALLVLADAIAEVCELERKRS